MGALPRLIAALAVIGAAGGAGAGPWRIQVEGGGEIDSNVQRVETGPDLDTEPYTAPLVRAGGRVERSSRRGAGGYSLSLSFAARTPLDRDVQSEDVATLGLDGRWLRAIGQRATAKPEPPGAPASAPEGRAAAGVRVMYVDALPLAGVAGTRTFRSIGGEGVLMLRRVEGDLVTLVAGARALTYKPDADFDWRGPTAGLRYDRTLWHNADDTRTVDLSAEYRVERRAYDGAAFANRCEPGADPAPMCFAPTDLRRADLYHSVSLEATYTGARVLSAGYQLVVVDSNSYGQSLIRHRLQLAATTELPGNLIGTATLTGQLDQYLDTLILARDVQSQSFTTVDDDNRSSLQLRAAHPISARLSFEARAAFWTDLLGPSDVSFKRLLVYGGVVWAND